MHDRTGNGLPRGNFRIALRKSLKPTSRGNLRILFHKQMIGVLRPAL